MAKKTTHKQLETQKKRAIMLEKTKNALRYSGPAQIWRRIVVNELRFLGYFEPTLQRMNIFAYAGVCILAGLGGLVLKEGSQRVTMHMFRTNPWMIEKPAIELLKQEYEDKFGKKSSSPSEQDEM